MPSAALLPRSLRACRLLSRLSERQWREAFRAARYDEQHTTRYISKIKQKIAQGLALTAPRRPEMSDGWPDHGEATRVRILW